MAVRDGFEVAANPPPLYTGQGVTTYFGNVAVLSYAEGFEVGYDDGFDAGSLIAPPPADDSDVAIAALDADGPITGLTPTWVAYYNATSGSPLVGPDIDEVGAGNYKFTPSGATPAGLIDLGAGAIPRYHVFSSVSKFKVFGAFDINMDPLPGLAPVWLSLKKVDDDSDYAQPDIEELGFGLYKTGWTPDHTTGVIDFGDDTAYPRYFHYDSELIGGTANPGIPPDIVVQSPVVGQPISRDQVVVIDVTTASALRRVVLSAALGGYAIEELVHDGTSFAASYTGGSNSRLVIAGGFQFRVLRLGGWRGTSVSLRVIAIDVFGNVAQKTLGEPQAVYTWPVIPSPPAPRGD